MFDFPKANYTTQQSQGNHIIYLEGGTLNIFNEIIVSATGIYAGYAGGMYVPTMISKGSNHTAEVVLVPPDDQQEVSVPIPEEGENNGGTDNGGVFVTPMLLSVVMTVHLTTACFV